MYFLGPQAFAAMNPLTIAVLRGDQLGGYSQSTPAKFIKNLLDGNPDAIAGQTVDQAAIDKISDMLTSSVKLGALITSIGKDVGNAMSDVLDGGLNYAHLAAMPYWTAKVMSPGQWASIDPSAIKGLGINILGAVQGITADDINHMSIEQIKNFPANKIGDLWPDAASGFTKPQLEGMSDAQLSHFTGNQVDAMTDPDVRQYFIDHGFLLTTPDQPLNEIRNLDVMSHLVVKFSSDIKLANGTIKIMDDMDKHGMTYKRADGIILQDTHDNDITIGIGDGEVKWMTVGDQPVIEFADGSSVTTKGNLLIIDPKYFHMNKLANSTETVDSGSDLDFGSSYHLELSAGVVVDANTSKGSLSSQSINFTTVTPTKDGASSQKFDGDGNLNASLIWHDGHAFQTPSSADWSTQDFGNGDHALVIESKGGNTKEAALAGSVLIKNFGAGDLIYNDNLGDVMMPTTESGDKFSTATWRNENVVDIRAGIWSEHLVRTLNTNDSFPGKGPAQMMVRIETEYNKYNASNWTDETFQSQYSHANSIVFG